MSDVIQPGITGRKSRGGDAQRPAAGAPAAGASAAPAASGAAPAVDGAPSAAEVAAAGTAEQAAQGAAEPVVIGTTETPIEPGGPGAGAAQLAFRSEGTVNRPLTGAEEAALGLRPLSEGERADYDRLRALEAGGGLPLQRLAVQAAGPQAGVVVDARAVPGRRLAQVTTTIKQDGVVYAPNSANPLMPVDFAAYTELVSIGAIIADDWAELEPDVA